MATFSARPTLSTMKKTVLRTIQGLVSKSIYRAIEIIMSPCCDYTATNSIECVDGKLVITSKISPTLHLLHKGLIIPISSNGILSDGPLFYDDSGVITFTVKPSLPAFSTLDITYIALMPSGVLGSFVNPGEDALATLTPGAFDVIYGNPVTVPPCGPIIT